MFFKPPTFRWRTCGNRKFSVWRTWKQEVHRLIYCERVHESSSLLMFKMKQRFHSRLHQLLLWCFSGLSDLLTRCLRLLPRWPLWLKCPSGGGGGGGWTFIMMLRFLLCDSGHIWLADVYCCCQCETVWWCHCQNDHMTLTSQTGVLLLPTHWSKYLLSINQFIDLCISAAPCVCFTGFHGDKGRCLHLHSVYKCSSMLSIKEKSCWNKHGVAGWWHHL